MYFGSTSIPDEAPALVEEVPLVAEAIGVPLEIRRHRHADLKDLAVEDERRRHHLLRVVFDRRVLEAELVLGRGTQHRLELTELRLLDAERLDEIDVAADDAERSLDMTISGVGFQNRAANST